MKENKDNYYKRVSSSLSFFDLTDDDIKNAAKKVRRGKRYKLTYKDYPYFNFYQDSLEKNARKENKLGMFYLKDKIEENIKLLCEEVHTGKYRLQNYVGVVIPKANGKLRTLLVPAPADRIIFTAILEKIKEKFKFLHDDLNIFGSGKSKRLKTIKDILADININRANYPYVLKIDIIDFFPSISRTMMIKDLEQYVESPLIMDLIENSFYNDIHYTELAKENKKLFPPPLGKTGIPQGTAYSPLFANFYARPFDLWLKGNKYLAYRYLDDLLIFIKDRSDGKRVFNHLNTIASGLKLEFHPLSETERKTYIEGTKKPIEYLGIEIRDNGFYIPEKKIDKMVSHIKNDLCTEETFKMFGTRKVLVAIKMYVSGWKNYYQQNCPKHYDIIKIEINAVLDEHYKKNMKGPETSYKTQYFYL